MRRTEESGRFDLSAYLKWEGSAPGHAHPGLTPGAILCRPLGSGGRATRRGFEGELRGRLR